MTANRSINRSLNLLAQPYTWAALCLLFLNDHVLRHLFPSWWTGKLGDLSWLFVAPVLLSLPISLLIPPCWKHQEKLASGLAYGLTAFFFIGLKTYSVFHDLILLTWKEILGFPAIVLLERV